MISHSIQGAGSAPISRMPGSAGSRHKNDTADGDIRCTDISLRQAGGAAESSPSGVESSPSGMESSSDVKSALAKESTLFSAAPPAREDACDEKGTKQMMIDGMLEGTIPEKDREKIYHRLERYPENALKMINDYGVKISGTPLPILSGDSGMYFPGSRKVRLARGSNVDYFIRHPRLSAFLDSSKPLALLAGLGAALGTALIFTALPASLLIAGAAGFALTPFSYFTANLLRERSIKNPLVHETAHALDSALGAASDFSALPVDSRVTFNYRTENIPFSMKSAGVIDCYLACKNGKEGSRFVTDYAAKDPVEYFAESVRAYLNKDNPGENAERADLEQKDPGMFRLIEGLFRDISMGSLK
ncbi:MAG: hypothetical protein AB2L14_23585 [Candidatus Xenobiia bacterium LiM19]